MIYIKAINSGNWSDPLVWSLGRVPQKGDLVYLNGYMLIIDETTGRISADIITNADSRYYSVNLPVVTAFPGSDPAHAVIGRGLSDSSGLHDGIVKVMKNGLVEIDASVYNEGLTTIIETATGFSPSYLINGDILSRYYPVHYKDSNTIVPLSVALNNSDPVKTMVVNGADYPYLYDDNGERFTTTGWSNAETFPSSVSTSLPWSENSGLYRYTRGQMQRYYSFAYLATIGQRGAVREYTGFLIDDRKNTGNHNIIIGGSVLPSLCLTLFRFKNTSFNPNPLVASGYIDADVKIEILGSVRESASMSSILSSTHSEYPSIGRISLIDVRVSTGRSGIVKIGGDVEDGRAPLEAMVRSGAGPDQAISSSLRIDQGSSPKDPWESVNVITLFGEDIERPQNGYLSRLEINGTLSRMKRGANGYSFRYSEVDLLAGVMTPAAIMIRGASVFIAKIVAIKMAKPPIFSSEYADIDILSIDYKMTNTGFYNLKGNWARTYDGTLPLIRIGSYSQTSSSSAWIGSISTDAAHVISAICLDLTIGSIRMNGESVLSDNFAYAPSNYQGVISLNYTSRIFVGSTFFESSLSSLSPIFLDVRLSTAVGTPGIQIGSREITFDRVWIRRNTVDLFSMLSNTPGRFDNHSVLINSIISADYGDSTYEKYFMFSSLGIATAARRPTGVYSYAHMFLSFSVGSYLSQDINNRGVLGFGYHPKGHSLRVYNDMEKSNLLMSELKELTEITSSVLTDDEVTLGLVYSYVRSHYGQGGSLLLPKDTETSKLYDSIYSRIGLQKILGSNYVITTT